MRADRHQCLQANENQGGNVTQPRAADDFATIRARMKELARETAEAAAADNAAAGRLEGAPAERDRRPKDRREGHPPPWTPTIFARPLGSGSAGRR
jgi:hypothetical protein